MSWLTTPALHHAAAGCDGKQSFDSYRCAMDVARRKTRRSHKMVAYRCTVCGKFHLSSMNKVRHHANVTRMRRKVDRALEVADV